MLFKEVSKDIFKLSIPFEDGFTSVFVLQNEGRQILMDFASCEEDGRDRIIPALKFHDFCPDYMVCTHNHIDHAGSIRTLTEAFPQAELIMLSQSFTLEGKNIHRPADGELLLNRYRILTLGGHTQDSAGILDTETNILLCSDCLQGDGSGKYGTNIEDTAAYINTLKKISDLDLDGIIASHTYEPVGDCAFGKDEVKRYINASKSALDRIIDTIKNNPAASVDELADIYNTSHGGISIVSGWTFKNVLEYLK